MTSSHPKVWYDSFRIYTANKTLNPDLGKSCTTGHYRAGVYPELHPTMLLKNTSNKPALEPWSKCHIYDFAQASVQAYWTEMCLNMTDSGRSKPPLATENLLENTGRGWSGHPISVISGRQPATFYWFMLTRARATLMPPLFQRGD